MDEAKMARLVEQAWNAFDVAPSRVTPAAPILFFGDLPAYLASSVRVVTVGLNPSLKEFPTGNRFRRFPPLTGSNGDRDPYQYINAMSGYFRHDPYRTWFSAYEALLTGTQSSYYASERSTALHTDLCSPVATDPTWGRLGPAHREDLQTVGVQLWHALLRVLRPQIVVMSIAKMHLDRIAFAALAEWQVLDVFERTGKGDLRKRPYEIRARWYEVGGGQSLFIFGSAAQKPFGSLANTQKRHAGIIALRTYQDGP